MNPNVTETPTISPHSALVYSEVAQITHMETYIGRRPVEKNLEKRWPHDQEKQRKGKR